MGVIRHYFSGRGANPKHATNGRISPVAHTLRRVCMINQPATVWTPYTIHSAVCAGRYPVVMRYLEGAAVRDDAATWNQLRFASHTAMTGSTALCRALHMNGPEVDGKVWQSLFKNALFRADMSIPKEVYRARGYDAPRGWAADVLYYAIENSTLGTFTELVRLLHYRDVWGEGGVPEDAKVPDGKNFLHRALDCGGYAKFALLAATDYISKNHVDSSGDTALLAAIRKNKPDEARVALWEGARLGPQGTNNTGPLRLAALYQRHAIVRMLLAEGACVYEGETYTPLHAAAGNLDAETCEALLTACSVADLPKALCARDRDGRTPLHWLCLRTHQLMGLQMLGEPDNAYRVCRLLTSYNGAGVSAVTNDGNTPLHLAVRSGCSTTIMGVLLDVCRAVLEMEDKSGQTPLHAAVLSSRPDAVMVLLQYGADPDVPCGADPDVPDRKGRNAYELAASNEDEDMAKALAAALKTARHRNMFL